jgi:protein-S-isoprenylcysteine O-methyltransferase Ste14
MRKQAPWRSVRFSACTTCGTLAALQLLLAFRAVAIGDGALLRGRSVQYGETATGGLFARCRQPIHPGIAMILWTTPCWSLDGLSLACAWSAYCVIGPRFKEARFLRRYGARFAAYQRSVPYLFPRVRR